MCQRKFAIGIDRPAWIDEALDGNRIAFARLRTAIEDQCRENPGAG
jgi:hypothetical protein